MLGLWIEDRRLALRDDLEPPRALPGEALLRVTLAGICGTDLELLRGYYPFAGIPGHEFVGVVERGPDDWLSARVVGEINAACGRCATCAAGRRTHCPRRTVLGIAGRHGAFAEYVALPLENLHRVPDGVADDAAVFVEPLAAALQILEQVPLGPGDRVLVAGDGRLGQLVARVLDRTGCELLVVGRHPAKLELLRRAGLRAGVGGDVEVGRYDVAVECTGDPAGFELARRALRPRGTLVLKSTYAGRLTLDASALVVDEITLVGSRCGPFAPALDLLAGGDVDPRPLIQARFPLTDGPAAFRRAAAPGVLKVLLEVA